ncbi:MAG: hypothetical protein KH086_01270 [Coprobacillus sp.]|nr:hypothetical protein [Coprobacillus sp.]
MGRLTLEEEITHITKVAAQLELDNEKMRSENYKLLQELKSYKDLEEQGLLVRLPCKIGDTVWDNDFGYPESYEIKAFSYGYCDSYVEPDIEDEIIFYYENYSGSITGAFPMSEIGKTVFLTREEAEKKLKEMKNDGSKK